MNNMFTWHEVLCCTNMAATSLSFASSGIDILKDSSLLKSRKKLNLATGTLVQRHLWCWSDQLNTNPRSVAHCCTFIGESRNSFARVFYGNRTKHERSSRCCLFQVVIRCKFWLERHSYTPKAPAKAWAKSHNWWSWFLYFQTCCLHQYIRLCI